jgi:hypothetical protein
MIRRTPMIKINNTSSPKYWMGTISAKDDFGMPISTIMIDGKTTSWPWARMNPQSWALHGVGKLGTGYGQKYQKQSDGKWLKIEG